MSILYQVILLNARGADIRHRSLGSPQTTTDMGNLRPWCGSPNFSCIALLFSCGD